MSNIAVCLCGRIKYHEKWIGVYPELVMNLLAQEIVPEVVDCDRCANALNKPKVTTGALLPTLGRLG